MRLSSYAHVRVLGFFTGDVIHRTKTINLSRPSAPTVLAAPSKRQLTFSGKHSWPLHSALLVPVTKFTRSGVIAMVDAININGDGTTTVTYHKGGLLNAFNELDLLTQLPLTPTKTGTTTGSHLTGSVSHDFFLGKSFQFGKDPSVSGDAGLHFRPSMSLSVTIHQAGWLPDGVSVHFAIDTYAEVSANITASGSWGDSATFPLGSHPLGAIPLAPGIAAVPELSANLRLAANAAASMSMSRSIGESAHVGFTMTADHSGVSKWGDSNNGFARPTVDLTSAPSFSASAQASATFTLEFALTIDGLAGPDAQASAGIELDVNPSANPWWEVKATGSLGIGVDLNALNLGVLKQVMDWLSIPTNPTWRIGNLGPYIVASSGGPLGGSTGGSGGGGGSGGTSGGVGTVGGSSVGPVPPGSLAETTGGPSRTFTDYLHAGGVQGPTIAGQQTVGISCKVTGFRVSDGNTSWYQVSSSPWNSSYYVSADAFYNNGQTSGSLAGTPFVDNRVPDCQGTTGGGTDTGSTGGATGTAETAGSVANTWTNYTNAGGTQGPAVASGQTILIACKLTGFKVADGNTWWYQIASSPWSDSFYVSADAFYNNGATSGSLVGTPFVDNAVPDCSTGGGGGGGTGGSTYTETTGGVTHTWTNYSNAGGTQGQSIAAYASVQITCRVQGFQVADGNTWWYQIASTPWSNAFYASADAFYNNGQTSGSLVGTPFYDSAVPVCGGSSPPPPTTWAETTGSITHTWTNYTNAGGTEGQSIASNATVQITCRVQGFQVADGNTWWYRIASSPWNNAYYASADAFYNNGQTSGSLVGTPFVDTNVAMC